MAVFTITTCLLGLAFLLLTGCGLLFVAFVSFVYFQHSKYDHIPAAPRKGFFSGHARLMMEYQKKNMPFSDALVDIVVGGKQTETLNTQLFSETPDPQLLSAETEGFSAVAKRLSDLQNHVGKVIVTKIGNGKMRKYGPVFHIFIYFSPVVIVLDPDFVKDILCTNIHPKPYSLYKIFKGIFGTRFMGSGLVSELNPVSHAPKRALLNPAFHRKYLQSLMKQFNVCADVLIEKLSRTADGKTDVAMSDELNRTTLDVIAKVAFGMDLNATLDDNCPFKKAINACITGASIVKNSPLTEFSPLPAARKKKEEVRDSIIFLRETGRQCIQQRLQAMERQEDVPPDILTHILKEVNSFKGDGAIDMEGLIDEFITFFFAGQETTANLLSFTLVELGHNPDIMYRLKTEVESIFGDDDYLEYADISKLSYMMQVFKEVLRLWPPVTGTARQLACDATVQGYKLPRGTIVVFSSFAMARMDVYFHDPLQFDPDRFKASDDKPHYAYFPFSLGSRNCIGQQFALIEARVILARLLHKFNFDLVPGQGHGILDEITLKPSGRCRNYIRLVE